MPGDEAAQVDPQGSRSSAEPVDVDTAWLRLLAVRTEDEAASAGLLHGADGRWEWKAAATGAAAQLAALYAPLCLSGPRHAYAQLGQSLDGCIATRTGDANFVTGEEDRQHLHRLRALADAVVVGAATVLADDPQLTVRAAAGTNPVRVILDPRGRVAPDRRLFTDRAGRTVWVVGDRLRSSDAPPQVEVLRLPGGDSGRFAADDVLAALADRGLGRVLVEGGGVTVSRFVQERAIHRLYLTVAPVLIGGDGVRGIRVAGSAFMRDALRPPARRFCLGEDVLFELDLTAECDLTRHVEAAASP